MASKDFGGLGVQGLGFMALGVARIAVLGQGVPLCAHLRSAAAHARRGKGTKQGSPFGSGPRNGKDLQLWKCEGLGFRVTLTLNPQTPSPSTLNSIDAKP